MGGHQPGADKASPRDQNRVSISHYDLLASSNKFLQSPKHGVCCSIRFNDGPNGEVYVPEKFVKKHPGFAALFDNEKHLERSPTCDATVVVVVRYLRKERLPGLDCEEPSEQSVRRLFKVLLTAREDIPRFPLRGLEELITEGIIEILHRLSFMDILEVLTQERQWHLEETDDLLIHTLTIRLGLQTQKIPDKALQLVNEFLKENDEVKWALLRTTVELKIHLQRSEAKWKDSVLSRYKET